MKWELYIRDEWMREIWKVLTVIEKWLKGWWFSRKCARIESSWKFGIDWEKREFGPHRGKDGERVGERQREGGSGIKWKVKKKRGGWRYMGIRVWWRKYKRKKKGKKKEKKERKLRRKERKNNIKNKKCQFRNAIIIFLQ